jgi:flagellar protein FlgJ
MTAGPVAPSSYADFSGLEALKRGARANDSSALRETARQFESLFTRMMLKSMREASLGEGMGDSQETAFYQDMFDQQLSVQLSKGNGIGLASSLVEQLVRAGATGATGAGAAGNGATVDPTTVPLSVPTTMRAAPPSDTARQNFVTQLRPLAEQAAGRLGVAPESIIAHAALETDWGRHLPADARGSSSNLFGIKAGGSWQGSSTQSLTSEFSSAGAQQLLQGFRSYDSAAGSVADYSSLLSGSPRYAAALNTGSDVTAFATALKHGGYATDPDYVQKLVATAASVRHYLEPAALKGGEELPIAAGRQSI